MTYQDFKDALASNHKFAKQEYYSHILKFHREILEDITYNEQKPVAADLHMSQSKLSTIVQLLRAVPLVCTKLNSKED